jgi:hypothetical protein
VIDDYHGLADSVPELLGRARDLAQEAGDLPTEMRVSYNLAADRTTPAIDGALSLVDAAVERSVATGVSWSPVRSRAPCPAGRGQVRLRRLGRQRRRRPAVRSPTIRRDGGAPVGGRPVRRCGPRQRVGSGHRPPARGLLAPRRDDRHGVRWMRIRTAALEPGSERGPRPRRATRYVEADGPLPRRSVSAVALATARPRRARPPGQGRHRSRMQAMRASVARYGPPRATPAPRRHARPWGRLAAAGR